LVFIHVLLILNEIEFKIIFMIILWRRN